MYLKSIEIHGFKSFANKIVFQFHNGITGIVGPNGSGKSNVADAVRWVLGEQRVKQLRGGSMQDVIFSGTETRKPLSYAYVAITLDNSDHQLAIDYDEVTVARRIYRSGESEYLINGTPCRLKDVNELFYDTGIGKEGYSIIGQGQIDKILSGKPEERRELFDEAAGIVKFKRRKAAAQTKLENEKQNLVRVNDILSELEKQVGPLEKQSEVAKVYLRKKEELKSLDINVFLLENKRLREQLASAEEKYNLASTELGETGEKYEGIKEEYERIQQEIESLDVAIEAAREQLTDTGLMRGKLEGEINVLKEQINSAHGSETHLNNRKAALEEEIAGKEQEKQDILTDKKDTDTQVQEIAEAAAKAKADLEAIQNKITELNNNIEAGKNTIIGELNQRATIKSKMGRFDTMMEQINIRKAELNSRLLRAKSDEAAREETVKKLEEAYNFVRELGEKGETILFVGTKKQAQEAVKNAAERANMPYINQRWLGGMLTNFVTIRSRINRMEELEAMVEDGRMAVLPKKEQAVLGKELTKLQTNLGGARDMKGLPQALFVIDTKREENAIKEAQRLNIPVVALIDTNSDPDEVEYGIPCNDDAISAVTLMCELMADACLAGSGKEQVSEAEMAAEPKAE